MQHSDVFPNPLPPLHEWEYRYGGQKGMRFRWNSPDGTSYYVYGEALKEAYAPRIIEPSVEAIMRIENKSPIWGRGDAAVIWGRGDAAVIPERVRPITLTQIKAENKPARPPWPSDWLDDWGEGPHWIWAIRDGLLATPPEDGRKYHGVSIVCGNPNLIFHDNVNCFVSHDLFNELPESGYRNPFVTEKGKK